MLEKPPHTQGKDTEFTGERVVPGLVDSNLLNEHLSRYRFARSFAAGKRVLDAGCGSGYGSAVLAEVAADVIAIDAAPDAVAYAAAHYPATNLHFAEASCTALPAGPFELITAFEVIEHLPDWQGFLNEAGRALAAAGLFLVSTPNKLYYAETRAAAGPNPFHVHEFEYQEFADALRAVFPHVELWVQNHAESVVFAPVAPFTQTAAEVENSNVAPDAAHFFLAVCSHVPLPPNQLFVYLPATANLLRERERHITLLESEMRMKAEWLAASQADLQTRNREFDDAVAKFLQLDREMKERTQWVANLQTEVERRGARILSLQNEAKEQAEEFSSVAAGYETKIAELEQINTAKTAWALETEQRLTGELAQRTAQVAQYVEVLQATEQTQEEQTAWAQRLDRELAECQERFRILREERWVQTGMRLKMMADYR